MHVMESPSGILSATYLAPTMAKLSLVHRSTRQIRLRGVASSRTTSMQMLQKPIATKRHNRFSRRLRRGRFFIIFFYISYFSCIIMIFLLFSIIYFTKA